MTTLFVLLNQQDHIKKPVKVSNNSWKFTFESEKKEDMTNPESETIDYCKVVVEVLRK